MTDKPNLRTMVRAAFPTTNPSRPELRTLVEKMLETGLFPEVNLEDFLRTMEAELSIQMPPPTILDDEYVPWVNDIKDNIVWKFWDRYSEYTRSQGFIGPGPMARMDELTDEILDRLGDPNDPTGWEKRGMVVGQVQSGKTANYIGLINKAIDTGYRLIIVLAGIHDSLRSQTQLRIDSSIVGFDTKKERVFKDGNHWTGVGRLDRFPVHSLTSSSLNGDFSKKMANTSGLALNTSDPVVLVVKKNVSVLKNLVQWLHAWADQRYDDYSLITEKPLLIIDDEADNASINISKYDISSTNQRIRMLTGLFSKSSYVGYTATPFANIFIQWDENAPSDVTKELEGDLYRLGADLFPKDFIINIKAPSNYIGPARFFGIDPSFSDSGLDQKDLSEYLTHEISDFPGFVPDRHKIQDPLPDALPESLEDAIRDFILVCAARRCRGQIAVHNSMLVHVSRFVRWQDRVAELISDYTKTLADAIRFSDPEIMKDLEEHWNKRFKDVTDEIVRKIDYEDPLMAELSWSQIETEIRAAARKISVRAVHGTKDLSQLRHQDIQPLDYEDRSKSGLSVIAVGGNKLSRGLTLEGLCVSYYLRTSKMYDTLMQMGRWFGYRTGYLDLCRLYLSPDLNDWYKHITVAAEEVRQEFDMMKWMRQSPREFGLKVRTHPGVLQISSATKMRTATLMELSYSNRLIETYSFDIDRLILEANLDVLRKLLYHLAEDGYSETGHHTWRTTKTNAVLEFLQTYRTDQPNINPDKVSEYVEKQIRKGSLTNWTVVVVSSSRDKNPYNLGTKLKLEVGKTLRTNDPPREPAVTRLERYHLKKSHIISPTHEYLDIEKTDERFILALRDTVAKADGEKQRTPTNPSGYFIRQYRGTENALLLIYLLDPIAYSSESDALPVIGYGLSFPMIINEERVRYAANEVFRRNYYEEPDEDEQE